MKFLIKNLTPNQFRLRAYLLGIQIFQYHPSSGLFGLPVFSH